ncbi:hypothetical protein [Bailinhaonella thermotolerans]|uniref:Uncharacterized protein n=1 Tax=Bailinhaonella thermotolerans TaxID=1070861 RepID=A0A3A3ZZB5_9ACTN|nr:hypothetical protein [Bailinhaonella thermotolerans]RJL21029.1 hypothetical protein D5H75_38090 [Bailinhaonella thermotolerans]
MIEIRISQDGAPLTAEGPHSSEGARIIAAGIGEAVRLLNHATWGGAHLASPAAVYSIYGSLADAARRLPQALTQMEQHIADAVADGTVREDPDYGSHGGHAQAAAAETTELTRQACAAAGELSRLLDRLQSAVGGLARVDPGPDR